MLISLISTDCAKIWFPELIINNENIKTMKNLFNNFFHERSLKS